MLSKKISLFFCVFFFSVWSLSFAQFLTNPIEFRPLGLSYKVLKTKHFDVIYYDGLEKEAEDAASVLEENLESTRILLGHEKPFHLTVILNGYNDQSNGYVTIWPFRSEVEVPAIRGKYLEPGGHSWMETVLSHELAHAVEIDMSSLRLAKWFPETARTLNAVLRPTGFLEGIAVYRESQLHGGEIGRLKHSHFKMQYRASMGSKYGWTLSQAITPSGYSDPGGRHYLGGAHFVQYLNQTYGPNTYTKYSQYVAKKPYLGTALALRHATGALPYELNRAFRMHEREEEKRRVRKLGKLSTPLFYGERKGFSHHQPLWLDDQKVLSYASGYQERPALYITDIETGERRLLSHVAMTEDFGFSLDPMQNQVLYTAYQSDPLVKTKSLSTLRSVSLSTGKDAPFNAASRVYTPVRTASGEVWATRNKGQFSDWVKVGENGEVTEVCEVKKGRILKVAPQPQGQEVAVLVAHEGHQGIYFANPQTCTFAPKVRFQHATVYDPTWSADGKWLLFSADPEGVSNIYALHLADDKVYQVTNAPYGAFEAALSPKGDQLAFIWYEQERQNLATLPFDPARFKEIKRPFSLWTPPKESADPSPQPENPLADTKTTSYKTLQHLRFFGMPSMQNYLDQNHFGLRLQAVDILRRFYAGTTLWLDNGLKGKVSLSTARLPFQPSVSVFKQPLVSQTNYLQTGIGLDLSHIFALKDGVFPTVLQASLGYKNRELAPLNDSQAFTPFKNQHLAWGLTLWHRIQANKRDLRPNTGYEFNVQGGWDKQATTSENGLGFTASAKAYLPIGIQKNRSGMIEVGYRQQNTSSLTDLSQFRVLGYGSVLNAPKSLKVNADYLSPIWYVDRGMMTIPIFVDVIYGKAFAESSIDVTNFAKRQTIAGVSIGVQSRILRSFSFDFSWNFGYLFQNQEFKTIWN